MSRRMLIAGNWKMNGNKSSIDGIINFMNKKGCNIATGMLTLEDKFYNNISLC